jgi:ribonuclease E
MVKRMLIDATHPEETRVVVLDGTRLEEFDVETSTKKQNKSNIYLAKIVRVEPSLQAAFVDYGGNRHGFLAFSEIHPDYYQIPVADRERLLAEVQRHERHDEDDHHGGGDASQGDDNADSQYRPEQPGEDNQPSSFDVPDEPHESTPHHDDIPAEQGASDQQSQDSQADALPLSYTQPTVSSEPVPEPEAIPEAPADIPPPASDAGLNGGFEGAASAEADAAAMEPVEPSAASEAPYQSEPSAPSDGHGEDFAERPSQVVEAPQEERPVDVVGGAEASEDEDGDDEAEDEDSRRRRRFLASRHYKIQEVIKRRQIMLVQVVKEERGNKGAALTTYLSLAGRYCVLMPNSSRGGGVSRKITNAGDRRRLKSIMAELQPPKTAAVILRTAGAERSKPEIKRDYEYLMRTWDQIRENTLQSRAPALIHEEGNLIKRAIRDVYSKDIEDVIVEGEEGYKTAKDFMRMLTPSHSKKVQRYGDTNISLFQRYQVETQLEAINTPSVQLRSGGSIVFGQTEALVAIDVNSGRATRERHIEETALKTNLEAADEIARQLRLRDLAGLVVIDFIDMEENRNNHAVERRLKEALKLDRARIQVGRISHFGLLELSRQRLRPSLIETNFRPCGHCAGTGLIRSIESSSIYALRMIEEEGIRRRSSELTVTVHPDVALYLLNYKRDGLAMLEARYGVRIFVLGDANLIQPNLRIDRVKATRPIAEDTTAQTTQALPAPSPEPEIEDEVEAEEEEPSEDNVSSVESSSRPDNDQGGEGRDRGGRGRGRRRRRRGRGRDGRDGPRDQQGAGTDHQAEHGPQTDSANENQSSTPVGEFTGADAESNGAEPASTEGGEGGEQDRGARRRRRGRRGGRRRNRQFGEQGPEQQDQAGDGTQGNLDQSANGAESFAGNDEPADNSSSPAMNDDGQTSGRKRGFFSAIKETALSWTRGDTNSEAGAPPEQRPAARDEAPAEPAPRPVMPPPAPAPVVVQPPPPPPPPPAPVVERVAPPPPPPAPVAEETPSGPPKRGWWSQPKE